MLIDIYFAIKFYLVSFGIGLIALPLTFRLFSKFIDKGYGASRLIGLIIISHIIWAFSNLKILAFTDISIISIIFGLTSISVYFYTKPTFFKEILAIKYKIITTEILYATFYMLMILFRGANPKIEGIEKYMDFAIINSILRTPYLPLNDVWYSGLNINYYYFGQYLLATLIKITYISSSYGYNLCVAFLFANVCVITFSIGNTLTKSKFFASITVILLAIGGNLDYLYKSFILQKSDYFYAEARSLIAFTINEFPSYSFLISDLHAHIINIPNVLIFIAFTINSYIKRKFERIDLLSIGFILGVIFITNSWDYIIYSILTALLIAYLEFSYTKNFVDLVKGISLKGLLVLLTSIIPFLFFHLNFKPALGGVGLVTHDHSDFKSVFIMFGSFWLFCLPLLIFAGFKIKSLIYTYQSKHFNINHLKSLTINKFMFILLIFGLILIAIPDIIFLKDIYFFTNPPYFRANTVFKVWYQAWIILSIVSGYSLKFLYDKLPKYRINRLSYYLIIFVVVTFLSLLYTLNSVQYILGKKYDFLTLDGANFIEIEYPDQKLAIDWINRNINGNPKILEIYAEYNTKQTMFSTFTGLSVPVGWRDHEFGWRNNWPELSTRLGEIETIYRSDDITLVNNLLNKYQIDYVIVGRFEKDYLEKSGYINVGLALTQLSVPIYTNNDVTIYKVN